MRPLEHERIHVVINDNEDIVRIFDNPTLRGIYVFNQNHYRLDQEQPQVFGHIVR
jgi:hypothetical protein